MFEGILQINNKEEESETLRKKELLDAHEKAMRDLEQAFAKAFASGYITDADIDAARMAARERTEEKNIQI